MEWTVRFNVSRAAIPVGRFDELSKLGLGKCAMSEAKTIAWDWKESSQTA